MTPGRFSGEYHVMIVEDDEGYQELAKTLLSEYDLTVCASVEEALAVFPTKPFDLIFCDINLFGMTGLELLGQLKAQGLAANIPLVLCSAMADPETRKAAKEKGSAGFVAKPFDGPELKKLVQTLLSK